jgi:polysaccharide export outer membrane protein
VKKFVVFISLFSLLYATNIDMLRGLIIQTTTKADTYRIEAGDVLEVIILGEEDLARTVMVMHNGTISFPLVGEVRVVGLTTDQASSALGQRLEKYFVHPVVSITLQSPTLPYVSVFGEVLRQGAITYQRGLRVTDYIALAGGPTPTANLGNVRVVRFQMGGVPTKSVHTIDVDRILREGDIAYNYALKSGDWIYVPRRFTINWGTIISTLTLVVSVLNLYFTYDLARAN